MFIIVRIDLIIVINLVFYDIICPFQTTIFVMSVSQTVMSTVATQELDGAQHTSCRVKEVF